MLRYASVILFFTFSLSPVAATEEVDYELMFDDCTKSTDGPITGRLGVCAEQISEAIDIEINDLSKKILLKLASVENATPQEAVNSFNMAQQSWLKYRNLQCDLAGKYLGSAQYAYCPMKLGIARVKELRELVQ